MRKILLVEDDMAICQLLSAVLTPAHYEVRAVHSAEAAWLILPTFRPDLVLVDWMLPQMDGKNLIYRLRKQEYAKNLPIIILTAKSGEASKVAGLDAGADDYIAKPFSPRELIARIKALLRRVPADATSLTLECGAIRLQIANQQVWVDEQRIHLSPIEFRLLQHMLQRPNQVFSRDHLLDFLWPENDVEQRTVDVVIKRLRKALAGAQHQLETVRGVGYTLTDKPSTTPLDAPSPSPSDADSDSK